MSCIVFAAILVSRSESSPYVYALFRMVETAVGIMVAVLINRFLGRPKSGEKAESAEAERE
jgi:uncharacterized membrane protein YgaE (UPF0421/DUF939 family)